MLSEFAQFQAGDPLYDRGMVMQPAGTFEDDARNDRLPAVSWILPTSYRSEHPDHLPAAGADFVASKIEAIAANPKVWKKTAFILNPAPREVPRPGRSRAPCVVPRRAMSRFLRLPASANVPCPPTSGVL